MIDNYIAIGCGACSVLSFEAEHPVGIICPFAMTVTKGQTVQLNVIAKELDNLRPAENYKRLRLKQSFYSECTRLKKAVITGFPEGKEAFDLIFH